MTTQDQQEAPAPEESQSTIEKARKFWHERSMSLAQANTNLRQGLSTIRDMARDKPHLIMSNEQTLEQFCRSLLGHNPAPDPVKNEPGKSA